MSCKCSVCGDNEVCNPGDVCELCAVGQAPYKKNVTTTRAASSTKRVILSQSTVEDEPVSCGKGNSRKVLIGGGASIANRDPYGNDMTTNAYKPHLRVYSADQAPQSVQQNIAINTEPVKSVASGKRSISEGIVKNLSFDNRGKSFFGKWFDTLFKKIPFTLDNDVTIFQIFPDFSRIPLNSLGNTCDQVMVYGKLNFGVISENNDVEVFGYRDSNNNIIAQRIKNKSSGSTVKPARTIGVWMIWSVTAIVLAWIGFLTFLIVC